METDFRDALAEFLRADAKFLVVGAHALGVYGVPRATVDLDIWVEPTPENARRDLRVPYIGRLAFIRNKRASGRKKDLGDLESLGEE